MKKKLAVLLCLTAMLLLNSCNQERIDNMEKEASTIGNENVETNIETPQPDTSSGTEASQNTPVNETTPDSNINNGSDNQIYKEAVKVGDTVAGLLVTDISKLGDNIDNIQFLGDIQVSGTYLWNETGDGSACIITVDEASKKKIPVFAGMDNLNTIVLANNEITEGLLPGDDGNVEIIINNYSIGERQIMIRADLVEVVKFN